MNGRKHALHELYTDIGAQRERFARLRDGLLEMGHPADRIRYYSAPGRTELGGNHTDHQNGHVLAAAVNIDMAAAAVPTDRPLIRIYSDTYAPVLVSLDDLSPREEEREHSPSLVRGIAEALRQRGYHVGGFDLVMHSQVPRGSGLSSSAAFEVLIGTVMNGLYCGGALTAVELAQIGQWAENVYFGKPCGLMDQMASSVGDVVAIDFADPARPVIRKVALDLREKGYALAIIRCGDDHADLTDAYGAIPAELGAVAAFFGKRTVLEIPREDFLAALPQLREVVGDRAVLRTFHIWADDARAVRQAEALERDDMPAYFRLVRESGESSWMLLQNVVPPNDAKKQGLAFTLGLCRQLLGDRGACRVHGGGFAGTVQAYVPLAEAETFRTRIDAVLGEGACMLLTIRSVGGAELEADL